MQKSDTSTVNLFWTGGWDSTFRLLQLILLREKRVQPFYIIDEHRLSTGVEIRSMKMIKERLFKRYPKTKNLLLPTIFKEVFDISSNQTLTNNYNKILEHNFIGLQYEWLARFCSETGINGIEICVEKDSKAYRTLKTFIIQSGAGKDFYYTLDVKYQNTPEYELFRFFIFPVFNLTKLEMQTIAKYEGFDDFLELTWFCHTPINYDRPCGVCTPCVAVIEDGLGRRVPFRSRMRYYRRFHLRLNKLLRRFYQVCKSYSL